MSASTINRAANDVQLQARVQALAQKEVIFNAELADTDYGRKVSTGMAIWTQLYWPVAVDTELAYETAVNSGRGAPGYDQDVIPDANLTSAIVAHWPPDPPVVTPVVNP